MEDKAASAALGTGCCLVWVVALGLYLFSSYALYRIGRKFEVGSFIEYCIPIWNIYLLTRCAEITPWWLLAFCVPLGAHVAAFYLWGTIAARLGKEFWLWGILCALFGLPMYILAFDRSEPVPDPLLPFG